jgi:hypothetical protein
MPTGRSTYPVGASETEISGVADPSVMLQALLARESEALSQPRPAPVVAAAPPRVAAGGGGAAGSLPAARLPMSSYDSRMQQAALKKAEAEAQAARDAARYQQALQQADLSGPKKRNLPGGINTIGGFINDEDSMPWSMRTQGANFGTVSGSNPYANVPSTSPGDMFTAMNYRAAASNPGPSLAEVQSQRPRYTPPRR